MKTSIFLGFLDKVPLTYQNLAEHLAGHLGYLDVSYRQVGSEQAGVDYLKIEVVLTIGASIEFKEKAK